MNVQMNECRNELMNDEEMLQKMHWQLQTSTSIRIRDTH